VKTNKCIIVGNGPSIKNVPLERLSYPSFGMNRLKPGFRPTYYVNLRREHVLRMEAGREDYEWDMACIRDGVARCKERSFIWRGSIPLGLGDSRTTYMATERAKMWSDNMDHAFAFGGMTCIAAQIAVMLGFTELIMIGMDGNYKAWEDKDTNHYSKDYLDGHVTGMSKEKAATVNKTHSEMHKFIKAECAKRGVKVTNVNTKNYIVEKR
jgi:hypothetical protein